MGQEPHVVDSLRHRVAQLEADCRHYMDVAHAKERDLRDQQRRTEELLGEVLVLREELERYKTASC